MGQVKKIPIRSCTGCREAKNKKEMIRVVKESDGNISVDSTGRKNGRGAYICPNAKCLELAIKNNGLSRTLKTSIPEEVYQQLREELGEIDE